MGVLTPTSNQHQHSPLTSSQVSLTMLLLLPLLLLSSSASVLSSPLTAQQEDVSSLEAEHRTSVGDAFDSISKELRDSAVYPILLNPLSITKLHCGSIITFFDTSPSDGATVALDVCLTAFIIAKAIFVWELVANGLDLDRIGKSEVFGVLDKIGEFFDNIDLAGSGPEGEPFSSLFNSAASNKNIESAEAESEDPNFAPVQHHYMKQEEYSNQAGDSGYLGFGLDSWKSGPQTFPNIGKFASPFYGEDLPRSFSEKMSFGDLLRSTIHQLDKVISVENN